VLIPDFRLVDNTIFVENFVIKALRIINYDEFRVIQVLVEVTFRQVFARTIVLTRNVIHVKSDAIDFIIAANHNLLLLVETEHKLFFKKFVEKCFIVDIDLVEATLVILVAFVNVQFLGIDDF
jgi:hypothetical protein